MDMKRCGGKKETYVSYLNSTARQNKMRTTNNTHCAESMPATLNISRVYLFVRDENV
jgi:hypothetical protein